VHEPTSSVPARAARSIRRTTTIDMVRPDGLDRPLLLRGIGRDLTTIDGKTEVVDEATLAVTVDFADDRRVTEISGRPDPPGLDMLVGRRAGAGFRSAVDAALGAERAKRSLLYLLLDDVPVATLVSAFAIVYDADAPLRVGPGSVHPATPDVCAGWATGATIMVEIGATGRSPKVRGPVAPPLDRPDDPLAWHETEPLPPTGMRRRRRLDLVAVNDSVLRVDAMFRDSYMSREGVESVVHEYTVSASVDRTTSEVLAVDAVARVLPWVECSTAASSARRMIGQRLDQGRTFVRQELVGTSTCTHLNDVLRSIEDVVGLAPHLPPV
jgi:hypothetical protein